MKYLYRMEKNIHDEKIYRIKKIIITFLQQFKDEKNQMKTKQIKKIKENK